jgi:hypothetical protein
MQLERLDLYSDRPSFGVRLGTRDGKRRLYEFDGGVEREAFLAGVEGMRRQLRLGAWGCDATCGREPISVLIGTWNMGSAPPPPTGLSPWLGSEPHHTLLVIGLQEAGGDDLASVIATAVGGRYVLLCQASLVSIRLFAFCLASHAHAISGIHTGHRATGFGNLYGNKVRGPPFGI